MPTLTEVSVSVKLSHDPKTPVNDAIPFMVDTRKPNKLERVLPRQDSEDGEAIPDWIIRPKANCLRFIFAKDEGNEIYQDVECTYNPTSVLTFHGIKYNKLLANTKAHTRCVFLSEYDSNYGSGYINKILKILDTTALDNSRITRYKGMAKMYISVPFDKDILADVIMNDYRLSNMMALCEKTSTLGNRRLFSVAISLSHNLENEKYTENLHASGYQSDNASSYARVALAEKCINDDITTEIIAMISKLPNEESLTYVAMSIKHAFDMYETAYNDINYGNEDYVADNEGSFASKSSIAEGIKQLRKELPELFVNNYTRECPILPIMVSEEETRILRSQGFSVILYPKEVSSKYSRYYTAPDGYYVGLKRNRLSNRNLFPCLVTCYLLDHMKREGSETYKYYNGVSTDDMLHKHKLRPVPKAIALLYSNNPSDTSYHRKKALSFISALEQATGSEIVFGEHNVFSSEYSNLPLYPQVTRQEMWDKSDTEIMNIIINCSCYGYGSSVYRYFEEMLKVSIHVVVIRDGTFEPLIPKHKGVYIWDAPYMEHVVIFETFKTTYGNTSCSYEYLVKVSRPSSGNRNANRRNVENHKFHSEDSMIRSILLQKYSESQKPTSVVDAKEQLIDNFGKCREITMYDGSKIQTFTRPLTIAVTPDPTCFFDSHIRKMNKIKLEMGVELTDLLKRSTTKIIYFPNDESLWYWM